MKDYLLDTNTCIYYMKGKYQLDKKFKSIHPNHLFISELAVAELKFAVANSQNAQRNSLIFKEFMRDIQALPIFSALDIYATQKVRLKHIRPAIDDFDLLIGATALAHNMILVTDKSKYFTHLPNIKLENWAKKTYF